MDPVAVDISFGACCVIADVVGMVAGLGKRGRYQYGLETEGNFAAARLL
jgi:hypothetical protein